MQVLVTGATGFIGRYVTRLALQEGFNVFILVRNFTKAKRVFGDLSDDCRIIKCDLTSDQLWKKLPDELDIVFHLAALPSRFYLGAQPPSGIENPYELLLTNTFGTLNLLFACQKSGLEKFILSSSISVFGKPIYLSIDEAHPKSCLSSYALSKFLAESLCEHSNLPFRCIILRYSSVYGPHQTTEGIIKRFLKNATTDGKMVVFGRGKETRDFVHVYDVARANILAAKAQIENSVTDFNIGSGVETRISTLAKLISRITGAEVIYDDTMKVEETRFVFNISKATQQLGYIPEIDLKYGVSDFYNFIKMGKTSIF